MPPPTHLDPLMGLLFRGSEFRDIVYSKKDNLYGSRVNNTRD